MNASPNSPHMVLVIAIASILALLTLQARAQAEVGKAIVSYVQERLGLSEYQVQGGLGVLLAFARERLPKTQYNQLSRRMPNAEVMLEQTHLRGIVTGPLDDEDEYEAVLRRLGIAEPAAAQFASVVQEYLGTAGYYEERDALSRVFD